MNILLTGGAGFIGSHTADALIEDGHAVTILDDLSMGRKENVNVNAEFYQLDIRSDRLRNIFKDDQFDAVIHNAAQMDVRKSVENPLFDASINIIGTLNLLENCKLKGVAKFIFASTGGAIYGEQENFPAGENHPTRPVSPYGIAKLSIEKYLDYYALVYGMHYVSLRYSNVYGPRQNSQGEAGVVAIFTTRMLSGEQPVINGDGTQTRDYVYVDDVVKANVLALQCDKSETFNIGTGIETDVNEIFQLLRELTGAACEEKHGQAKPGEQQRSVIDPSRVEQTIGWKPTILIPEGLSRTVDYFKANFKKK